MSDSYVETIIQGLGGAARAAGENLMMGYRVTQQRLTVALGRVTCAECRHWGQLSMAVDHASDDELRATTYAPCALIKHATQQYVGSDTLAAPPCKGGGAATVDGEDYHSALLTESQFGCNRWEGKP
jgi:hypothetical protein